MRKAKTIITVSTEDYVVHTKRLLLSLDRTNSDFVLIVYCDRQEKFRFLEGLGNCRTIELAAIRTRGVKRAKFEAYYETISWTPFLYLDSDVVVLRDLSALFESPNFAACLDDLSGCDFIEDKLYPWEGDKSLRNDVYVNSGVFFAPATEKDNLKKMFLDSLDDTVWQNYILPGKLYDNHFLCAYLNKLSVKVDRIDNEIYNWPGFFSASTRELKVFRSNDSLVNKYNYKELALVHFAGVQNIEEYIVNLPVPIASLLAAYGSDRSGSDAKDDFRILIEADSHFRRGGRSIRRAVNVLNGENNITEQLKNIHLECTAKPRILEVGQRFSVAVTVDCTDAEILLSSSTESVFLSYHWRNVKGDYEVYDGLRTQVLPILPKERKVESMIVEAPHAPGTFVLEVTLVKEGAYWFSDLNPGLKTEITMRVEDSLQRLNSLKSRITSYMQHDYVDRLQLKRQMEADIRYGIASSPRSPRIVVSLTSFPGRIYEVDLCIFSLLSQTVKPDFIVLYLAEEDFPRREEDLPSRLLWLVQFGLTIRWCKNLRVFQKLVPALKDFPEDIIITVDDDVYYPSDLVSLLASCLEQDLRAICCHRMHRITLDEAKRVAPYDRWIHDAGEAAEDFLNFPTGVGGVLYPPHSLHPDVVKEELFQSLTPENDDIWFWAMSTLQGSRVRRANKEKQMLRYLNLDRDLGYTQEKTLASFNVVQKGNDSQIRNILSRYPDLVERILR